MPKSFQWITLLLIESIYFAGIRVKGPHTSIWIIPFNSIGPLGSTSKFQFHRTSGKHVQNSISMDLWEARPNFKPSDLWEPPLNFKSIKPLKSTSKLQIIGPLGSTSKFQFQWTSRKHVQSLNHQTSGKHIQISNPSDLWEARPNFKPSDLWEARPNFKSIRPLGSTSKNRTSRKHIQISIHQTSGKQI